MSIIFLHTTTHGPIEKTGSLPEYINKQQEVRRLISHHLWNEEVNWVEPVIKQLLFKITVPVHFV